MVLLFSAQFWCIPAESQIRIGLLSAAHFSLQKQAATVVTADTILRHGSAGGYCYRQHISALCSAAASARGVVIPGTVPTGHLGTATAGWCCYWQHISGFWLFGWDSLRAFLSIWHAHQAVHGSEKHFLAQDCYSAHSLSLKGPRNITVHRHFIILFVPLLSSAQFFVPLLLFAAQFRADVRLIPRTVSSSALCASTLPRSAPTALFPCPLPFPPTKKFLFFLLLLFSAQFKKSW